MAVRVGIDAEYPSDSIVDDDPELRHALTEQLSLLEEFEAVAVEDGSKGVQAAKAGQIDLVIMDVGLPDIDGRERCAFCARTGLCADSDSRGSGADDYVPASLRSFAGAHSGPAAPARRERRCYFCDRALHVSTGLKAAAQSQGQQGPLDREGELDPAVPLPCWPGGRTLREVWGYNSEITTHTLETHIYRLRQKIEQNAAAPTTLVAEAGGYKLVP